MRQTLWLVVASGTLTLAGCEGLRDAFSAQPDIVATAAGRRLTTDRLLALMNAVPQGTVSPEGARFLAHLWVDLQLFSRARVTGSLGQDSATVVRVMWPQVIPPLLSAWQDTLSRNRPQPTNGTADSAYEAGQLRLFQHVLVTPAGTAASDTAAARRKIGDMLGRIRRGAAFSGFADQNPDGSRNDQGFLGVGPRGQFVREFEDAAWALEPGQVSDVVQTQFGFHLIRRTPKDEALSRFLTYLQTTKGQSADSTYLADLARARGLRIQDDAAQTMKDAVADLDAARRSTKTLVRFNRGGFAVRDFVHWLEAFPPNASSQVATAPDSVLTRFLESLAQNALVLEQVDSAGLRLDQADWQAVQLSYRATVDQLAAALGLSDSAVADTTRPVAERLDSAASRVDRFLDRLIMGEVQFRPLPLSLSGHLRETGGGSRINPAGLNRALELYTARRVADSAAGRLGPAQPPPIQPAPGPAPVPGGDTARP